MLNVGAAGRIRTADLILTKDALYLLSYSSMCAACAALFKKAVALLPMVCATITNQDQHSLSSGDPERARTVDLQRDRLAF